MYFVFQELCFAWTDVYIFLMHKTCVILKNFRVIKYPLSKKHITKNLTFLMVQFLCYIDYYIILVKLMTLVHVKVI
jgi:hypothetical protein